MPGDGQIAWGVKVKGSSPYSAVGIGGGRIGAQWCLEKVCSQLEVGEEGSGLKGPGTARRQGNSRREGKVVEFGEHPMVEGSDYGGGHSGYGD